MARSSMLIFQSDLHSKNGHFPKGNIFRAILNKIPTQFFEDFEFTTLNFMWKNKKKKKNKDTKAIFYNKRTFGVITIPNFKLYYRSIVIKICFNIKTDKLINRIMLKNKK